MAVGIRVNKYNGNLYHLLSHTSSGQLFTLLCPFIVLVFTPFSMWYFTAHVCYTSWSTQRRSSWEHLGCDSDNQNSGEASRPSSFEQQLQVQYLRGSISTRFNVYHSYPLVPCLILRANSKLNIFLVLVQNSSTIHSVTQSILQIRTSSKYQQQARIFIRTNRR